MRSETSMFPGWSIDASFRRSGESSTRRSYDVRATVCHPLFAGGRALLAVLPPVARADHNPIVVENRLPGSRAWVIGQNGHQIADDQRGQIKGYASATSVAQGETLTFHVSVNVAQQYDALA